jgi:dolichyl-phosphate beta-glucosyltransferase
MGQSVSVVIPAFNEELRIGPTLDAVFSYVARHYPHYELIVVDDGSRDRTADVVRDFIGRGGLLKLLVNDRNRGKGYSVKRGALSSSGDIIAFTDADQSVPIEELPRFIGAIEEGFDMAIGSRALRDSDIIRRQAVWRETMGKIFNLFVQASVLRGIRDTQCGFKCFSRPCAMDLFSAMRLDGFAFDVELLYLAGLRGYRIKELPVKWVNSPESTVNPFSDSAAMLKELFTIKKLHRGGRTDEK